AAILGDLFVPDAIMMALALVRDAARSFSARSPALYPGRATRRDQDADRPGVVPLPRMGPS
ncbi:MAG: hypothetical protein U0794_20960, partial [Isosphaeraceae bacterium]